MAGGKTAAAGITALAVIPLGGIMALVLLVAGISEQDTAPSLENAACVLSDSSGSTSTGHSPIPNNWRPLVEDAAQEAGIPFSVAAAQLKQESGWDEDALSPAGAQGLAQFMPGTWATYGAGGDPFSAPDAIAAYGRYMAALKTDVQPIAGSDAGLLVRLTLAAYNAGPAAVQEHAGIPPYEETQQYVAGILATGQSEFSLDCRAPTGSRAWDGDLGDGEWTSPLPGSVITSGYGHRNLAGLPAWAQDHVGVDYAIPGNGMGSGGQVIAPTDLRITGFNDPDGCVIAKEDGNDPDFGFAFCHLNSYAVTVGDRLKRGDVIGVEGNRAQLGGILTHLHFEIYEPEAPDVAYPYQGWNLDPEPILKEKGAWPY